MKNKPVEEQFIKERVQETSDRITASEELKKETLERMKKAQEEGEQLSDVKKKRKSSLWRYSALAAALLCTVGIWICFLRPTGASYVTPMEEGVYYDKVELKNGVIHFVNNKVAISITPNAGKVTIGQDEQEDKSDEIQAVDVLLLDDGGMISFDKIDQISLPEIAKDNWSYIGEQKIYVTVLKTEKMRFQAVYEKNGIAYEVIGTGTTQKEFIDFLYEKVME